MFGIRQERQQQILLVKKVAGWETQHEILGYGMDTARIINVVAEEKTEGPWADDEKMATSETCSDCERSSVCTASWKTAPRSVRKVARGYFVQWLLQLTNRHPNREEMRGGEGGHGEREGRRQRERGWLN